MNRRLVSGGTLPGAASMWQSWRVGRRSRAIVLGTLVCLVCLFALRQQSSAEDQPSGPAGFSLLRDLHITGFFQNTTGMFINTAPLHYHKAKNQLSTERNLLQVDTNYRLDANNQFFMRNWFVYEPSYGFERDASIGSKNTGDFYNEYGVRELWWSNKLGPLKTFVGRQIVTWGEATSFRVGDVINPQDLSYSFGFANLEQSRLPLWMLHPILSLPTVGDFGSNFIEAIYVPGVDFLYNHVDYPDDRFKGQNNIAGRVSILPPGGSRLGGWPDTRCVPGVSFCVPGVVVEPPISNIILGGQSPDVKWTIPRTTVDNSQVGLRFHTLISGTELTALYWRSHDYTPTMRLGPKGAVGTSRRLEIRYPQYQGAGITANRPLNLPGELGQLPLVLRGEAFYKNGAAINTKDLSVENGLTHSDTLTYMLALDAISTNAPWLTSSGTLDTTIEVSDKVTLNSNENMLQAPGYLTPVHEHEVSALVSTGTSWNYGTIVPNLAGLYNPDGNTVLLFPTLILKPPWTTRYFIKFGYVGIVTSDKFAVNAGGTLKGLDQLYVQMQYNMNAL